MRKKPALLLRARFGAASPHTNDKVVKTAANYAKCKRKKQKLRPIKTLYTINNKQVEYFACTKKKKNNKSANISKFATMLAKNVHIV